jgi:hypothetical protein
LDRYEVRRLTVAATPDEPGPGGVEVPDDDVADEEVDVLTLAGQRPPAAGAWLRVTAAGGAPGGEVTALFLPRNRPHASGGGVLLCLAPGAGEAGQQWPGPVVRVRVHAVAAGKLVLVAVWDRLDLEGWPEAVRATVAFALGAVTELEAHGADTGARMQVGVEAAAGSAVSGFPALRSGARAGAGG